MLGAYVVPFVLEAVEFVGIAYVPVCPEQHGRKVERENRLLIT